LGEKNWRVRSALFACSHETITLDPDSAAYTAGVSIRSSRCASEAVDLADITSLLVFNATSRLRKKTPQINFCCRYRATLMQLFAATAHTSTCALYTQVYTAGKWCAAAASSSAPNFEKCACQ
jgi:hypothetical protein